MVQAASMPAILERRDVLVKAKTGTGKTLGFLVPAIEVLIDSLSKYELNKRQSAREGKVSAPPPIVVVLSPTRELAQQIAVEAKALCTFHKLNVATFVGDAF